MKKILLTLALLVMFTGCFTTDADVASRNLSQDADSFKVFRRAIFYNGITGEYMLTMQGYLSIQDQGNQLEVTVKTDSGTYLKHFLGLSDNVTYFVEQLESRYVSDTHYKVIFKPLSVVPNIEIQ